jgi:hypothetical protein
MGRYTLNPIEPEHKDYEIVVGAPSRLVNWRVGASPGVVVFKGSNLIDADAVFLLFGKSFAKLRNNVLKAVRDRLLPVLV